VQISFNPAAPHNTAGDIFILSRKLNHPELLFNQIPVRDSTKHRFFKVDAGQSWTLSSKDECYICEKHHYTVLFYERSKNCNKGLIEIKDSILLGELKKEFQNNIGLYKNHTPLVCGTVVNKNQHCRQKYSRKLKMIPAPIYCLLQICQSDDFIIGGRE